MRETRGPSGVSRVMCCSLSRRREGERGGRGERSGPRRRFDAACPWSVSSVPSVEKRGGRILVVLERGRWCCVRACVRTCGHLELASWMFGNALQPRGTSQELGLPLASCAGWRPLLAGSPRDEEGRSAGWDGARGKAVCMCALSGGHACALHVFLCVLVRVCREDAAARARAPLRARERASERERERLAGSLEADWWPDRALRPTVAASGRRLTESGNARRRRRGAASTRPPWPDSRLWTIDRSVHPPRRRKMYRKWGLDINLARRCFPLRTNL